MARVSEQLSSRRPGPQGSASGSRLLEDAAVCSWPAQWLYYWGERGWDTAQKNPRRDKQRPPGQRRGQPGRDTLLFSSSVLEILHVLKSGNRICSLAQQGLSVLDYHQTVQVDTKSPAGCFQGHQVPGSPKDGDFRQRTPVSPQSYL